MITVVLRSKTAHAFYGALSFRKRKQWLYKMANDLDKYERFQEIKSVYFREFSAVPYSGTFLFYLLFEDRLASEPSLDLLAHAILPAVSDFDYVVHLSVEKIEDPCSYYDVNRVMKLRDRMAAGGGDLLQQVVDKLKQIGTEDVVPSQVITQCNLMLLEMASEPDSTVEQFGEMVEQIRSICGYDVFKQIS